MLDSPDVIRKKLKSAVTDSGRDIVRADDKPGITNLIEILAVSTGRTPEQVEEAYEDILQFERQLADSGTVIVKFWLHISREEQEKRFEELQEGESIDASESTSAMYGTHRSWRHQTTLPARRS